MSTDDIDPSKKDATISSTDDLVKTTNKADVELSEEELKRVSGGGEKPVEYLKIKLTDVLISGVQSGGS